MERMLESLHLFTRQSCRLMPGQLVLVGVSGGADSVCLIDALGRLGYSVIAAHFNHHLHGNADDDAGYVKRLASDLGLPFVAGEGDVIGHSKNEGLSLEESARTLRYNFLFTSAQQMGAQVVAVGHTADDQVETVLMHLLRGAGLDGLIGMRPYAILPVWHDRIPLVRPLLETSREAVLNYCREHGWQPRTDPTNLDTNFFRNRLRHELIPALETYNPRFREVIARTAKTLVADQDALQEITDLAWQGCVHQLGLNYLEISTSAFIQNLRGIQRRLLRKGISWLRPGLRDIDFAAIERALKYLSGGQDGVCELTGNLRMFLEGDRFWLAEKEANLPTDEWPQLSSAPGASIQFGIFETVQLLGRWTLHAEQSILTNSIPDQPDQAWLDADSVTLPFHVRVRLPGDRFQPLGMGGKTVKLSDFMINAKIPRRARSAWPLVCVGDQIAWIPGVRLAEPFRVTETTRKVVKLNLKQERAC